jgi:hypothetical protein
MPKLLFQCPVDERVFCDAGWRYAEAVRDPGASVGGKSDIKWPTSELLVEIDRLMRIAVLEHINAVVAEAGDPDIPPSV